MDKNTNCAYFRAYVWRKFNRYYQLSIKIIILVCPRR